ncbi:hypothetical protein HDF23_000474 [Mucilaginibacter lappiensis]|uniref:Uncharacterized protein n=1 Tax=Mucilaginibacter lappiensis TaxID=354630 RepID=A0ABR6PES8_9SPHI|nr:hypothetical protein [Mucilaginibacter lappiensis]MBB6107744.1 hypothetical protein [Mucilaginibacter lappiensis]
MKILTLKTRTRQTATEKMISAILERNIDAFKLTSRQFIRNNQLYFPGYSGLIA